MKNISERKLPTQLVLDADMLSHDLTGVRAEIKKTSSETIKNIGEKKAPVDIGEKIAKFEEDISKKAEKKKKEDKPQKNLGFVENPKVLFEEDIE